MLDVDLPLTVVYHYNSLSFLSDKIKFPETSFNITNSNFLLTDSPVDIKAPLLGLKREMSWLSKILVANAGNGIYYAA